MGERIQICITDIITLYHINPCNLILSIMKYGVNRVTLVSKCKFVVSEKII